MRCRAPLLLLLATAALAGEPPSSGALDDAPPPATPSTVKFSAAGTKDAPVDGKDGRPHEGPFVEIENLRQSAAKADKDPLPPLKDRPFDPTVIDGKRIPETNDGVMDDKNRPEPKVGTTGTAGGVSEKDKARKEQEGRTGEKVENRPETPKEAPPLPHSEQEKQLLSQQGDRSRAKGKPDSLEDAAGFEKPTDLPDKIHDNPPPIPNSANKDHLDVSNGGAGKKSSSSYAGSSGDDAADVDDAGGVIQPLHSFFLSLTMILFSEVGDKTFLVAALMAMKHDRLVVFSAAFSALITMTVLSAVLGHAVPTLIPKRLTSFLAAGLFLVFGARMLREGLAMSPDEGVTAEMQEVELELAEKEQHMAREKGRQHRGLRPASTDTADVSPYSLEMGLGPGRRPRSKSRFPSALSPARSPSTSPDPSPRASAGLLANGAGGGAGGGSPIARLVGLMDGLANLVSLLISPAWVQTFVMTFLGEWGDRSQIATIAMAAGQDYWWVTLGAVLGHAVCTSVAVIGGRAIAGRVSLKVVTVGGAVAFLVFGVVYMVEAFYT